MREPHNVVVLVFRGGLDLDAPMFCVFRRSDDGHWQPVQGGVEHGETPVEAARRETAEEAGLTVVDQLHELDMVSAVPRTHFAANEYWPSDVYVVRKHYFALGLGDQGRITLSDEHSEFTWVSYDDAQAILTYDDDRTALWELSQRIRHAGL